MYDDLDCTAGFNGEQLKNRVNNTYQKEEVDDLLAGKMNIAVMQGELGFSIEPCPATVPYAVLGLAMLAGTNSKGHDDYGNYIHTDGSIVCFAPRKWYRIGHVDSPRYATYGANAIDIEPGYAFADEAEANAAGYVLHRAFIDGGNMQEGFFIDKYTASKKATDSNVAVSVKNGIPISLTTDANYTNSSGMTGCVGQLHDAVTLCRARGEGWNVSTGFMKAWLVIASIAHGQAATSTTECAWYDPTGVKNFPKGCNNGSLSDSVDSSVIYETAGDAGAAGKPKTGSAGEFAKTTHNGCANGVADLNGGMWEVDIGVTNFGTSATASTQILDDTIYVLKQSVALADLTGDFDTATSIWGTAANLADKYDLVTAPIPIGSEHSSNVYWGNGTNAVLDDALSGQGRDLCGYMPKNTDSVLSSGGSNLFGNDYIYKYNRQNMFVRSCGYWVTGGDAGLSTRSFVSYRASSVYTAGFRAGAYA